MTTRTGSPALVLLSILLGNLPWEGLNFLICKMGVQMSCPCICLAGALISEADLPYDTGWLECLAYEGR